MDALSETRQTPEREPVSKTTEFSVHHDLASDRMQAERDPIKVFPRRGQWLVDYGSYAHGYYSTRSLAVAEGRAAARRERRELSINDLPETPRPAICGVGMKRDYRRQRDPT
jgi:hypothetical protein